ncbi:hypothetical protein JAAARDRAFT_63556 [Jaapia argillacea MUCL 33604]|uniref:Uncharacterized protein n=1 Tax=Jaapia argillacea MUCL 33604 TaxID=933084 RepID=A0A067P455_9AGAM|nr:hypothetical protein JAAARDRAFT_63556 [Jaapia argillacea MUCL 33604]
MEISELPLRQQNGKWKHVAPKSIPTYRNHEDSGSFDILSVEAPFKRLSLTLTLFQKLLAVIFGAECCWLEIVEFGFHCSRPTTRNKCLPSSSLGRQPNLPWCSSVSQVKSLLLAWLLERIDNLAGPIPQIMGNSELPPPAKMEICHPRTHTNIMESRRFLHSMFRPMGFHSTGDMIVLSP